MLAHRVMRQEGHLEGNPREGDQRYMRRGGGRVATYARPGEYVSRTGRTVKIRCAVLPRRCPSLAPAQVQRSLALRDWRRYSTRPITASCKKCATYRTACLVTPCKTSRLSTQSHSAPAPPGWSPCSATAYPIPSRTSSDRKSVGTGQ